MAMAVAMEESCPRVLLDTVPCIWLEPGIAESCSPQHTHDCFDVEEDVVVVVWSDVGGCVAVEIIFMSIDNVSQCKEAS